MACPKENSLVALNAHNHMEIELLRVWEYKNTRNEIFQTEAINKRKSIEQSVQRFTVNAEIENGFRR